jgi:hypothetical protein
MPRIFDYPRQHRTGGLTSRDAVYWAAWPNTGASLAALTLAGGPLDAPDVMPAGCMVSTTWTDAHGRAVPSVAGFERG